MLHLQNGSAAFKRRKSRRLNAQVKKIPLHIKSFTVLSFLLLETACKMGKPRVGHDFNGCPGIVWFAVLISSPTSSSVLLSSSSKGVESKIRRMLSMRETTLSSRMSVDLPGDHLAARVQQGATTWFVCNSPHSVGFLHTFSQKSKWPSCYFRNTEYHLLQVCTWKKRHGIVQKGCIFIMTLLEYCFPQL